VSGGVGMKEAAKRRQEKMLIAETMGKFKLQLHVMKTEKNGRNVAMGKRKKESRRRQTHCSKKEHVMEIWKLIYKLRGVSNESELRTTNGRATQ
jgi:hypothetical protein